MAAASREWTDVAPELHVRVFQWNVLADCCADDTPEGFPYVPKEALDPILRRPMQLREIIADNADVIALEEVDRPCLFEELLKEEGYYVLYNKREDSPLGVLVAYKEDEYTVEAKNMITFAHGGQVATILLLKDNRSGRKFVFAATHLKAGDNDESKRVRGLQSKELLSHVKNMSDDWTQRRWRPEDKREAVMSGNVILAGDLNDDTSVNAVNTWTELDGFVKALPERFDKTTFKMRKGEYGNLKKCCAEDYIIHNGTTARVRKLPQDFEDPYLPSEDFPSDHLSLCADIVFTN